ncbi:hypothetical protein GCM10010329_48710 [Streptomyces spiroverticillatus]|nr:hypothetical protein GCM10010329_48710 [Streptomyces spiroverticillatus]
MVQGLARHHLTRVASDNAGRKIVWRDDKALLFRGTGGPGSGAYRTPEHVFSTGMDPTELGPGGSLRVRPGVQVPNSGLSSTSYRTRHPKIFGQWVYVVDAPGGLAVDAMLETDAMDHESEIAFVGGIKPEFIVGAFRYNGKGVWKIPLEYRVNPGYKGVIQKPGPNEVSILFGTGPHTPGTSVQAVGGRAADPYGRAFNVPKSAATATLAADAADPDPYYMPWGTIPTVTRNWALKTRDPYVSLRAQPWATCHKLGAIEFVKGLGGLVDTLGAKRRSAVTDLSDKVPLRPGSCYDAAEPPRKVSGSLAANGELPLTWQAPAKGAGRVASYAVYVRGSDTVAWRQVATVPVGTTRLTLAAATVRPAAMADLDPAKHAGRVAVTALFNDGTETTLSRLCGTALGEFGRKWAQLGGASGSYGCPTSDPQPVPGGTLQLFAGGSLYKVGNTVYGVRPEVDAIGEWYRWLDSHRGRLKLPVSDERKVKGGSRQDFQGGRLYWAAGAGRDAVFPVWATGAIGKRYRDTGAENGPLGLPTTPEYAVPGGWRQDFQGGTVYWSRTAGIVSSAPCKRVPEGAFTQKWYEVGGGRSKLRCMVGTYRPARAQSGGVVQQFEGGFLYWSRTTGTHPVWSAIGTRYRSLGAEAGYLGLPVGDEEPRGNGDWLQRFQGGTLIWVRRTGQVRTCLAPAGAFAAKWDALGGATGRLGCTVGSHRPARARTGGVVQQFDGGFLYWSRTTGTHAVWGGIGTRHRSLGAEAGRLGMPVGDEEPAGGGNWRQRFQGGTLVWVRSTGQVTG